MKEKMLICDDCFHYLATKSAAIASFWSYLCTLYISKVRPKKPPSQYDSRFTTLEEEGFILTTEVSQTSLGIVFLGLKTDSQVICLNKHL